MHVFVSHVVILRRLDPCQNPRLLNVSWKFVRLDLWTPCVGYSKVSIFCIRGFELTDSFNMLMKLGRLFGSGDVR